MYLNIILRGILHKEGSEKERYIFWTESAEFITSQKLTDQAKMILKRDWL